jgi:TRAP-type mannitol/chloroaromatic compound transport system substrate-binding protein
VKRREFLRSAAAGTVAGAIAAPAIAQTPGQIRWRMATSWPKSLDTIHGSAIAFCDRVTKMTQGALTIQPFAAGEIVGGLQVLDAVQNGTIECGHTLTSFYFGKSPAYSFDAGLAFGMNARQQNAWVYEGGGMKILRDFYAKEGLINLPIGGTGVQMGGWFRKEINSLDDLRGLKMRIGGLGGLVFAKLGAVPQQIPTADIYPALERGTIDAAEWIGPYDDEKLGFVKVAKYYYTPGWWEGSASITGLFNAKAWAALPSHLQEAVEAAAAEQMMLMVARYDARNPDALRRLIASGAELRGFPQSVMDASLKASLEVYKELSDKNEDFRAMYESWKTFLNNSNGWFRIAEQRLDTFRFGAPRF